MKFTLHTLFIAMCEFYKKEGLTMRLLRNKNSEKIDNIKGDNSILKTEYETTSETEQTVESKKPKAQMKLNSVTFGKKQTSAKESAKDRKSKDEEGKFLNPEPEIVSKRISVTDLNSLEKSSDGITIFPVTIPCYEHIILSDEEIKIAKKIGRKSYFPNPDGTLSPCLVVKCINCFTVLIKLDDGPALLWIMGRIDLLKKVKGSDGSAHADIQITDNLSSKKIRVPISKLSASSISSLVKYNVSIYSDYAFTLGAYFQKLAEKMPMEDASQVLGVVTDTETGDLTFNGYNTTDAFEVQSEYDTFEEYLDEFNSLLKQSEPLQYLLAATMAAPALTILQQKYNYDLHSYCINPVGSSSTGKTIASRVCASMWTNPTSDKIFSAMLATGNAALKRLAGRYGVPIFLDEATILGSIKADEYGYSVYEGREKRRLNSDCSEKASGTWSTIVCMSSEQHFHNNAKNQNGGLAVRVHSMENLSWIASKEHAEQLNDFIKNNYGVLGREFTDVLFSQKINSLPKLYKEAIETMNAYCETSHNDFTDRLCQIYALTLMTAQMLEEMGVAIDVEAVAGIMADHNHMISGEQNLGLNAFNAIVSYIARNSEKSGIRKELDNNGIPVKVIVEYSLMAEILTKAGFTDIKVAVKELDKSGFLIRQVKAGLKSKLTINGNLCWCYQIDLSTIADGAELTEKKPNTSSKPTAQMFITGSDDDWFDNTPKELV